MGLQSEDLAPDSGLQCELCHETVNYGDAYVTHLKIIHNIHKNYSFFLSKAKDSIKGGNKRKGDIILYLRPLLPLRSDSSSTSVTRTSSISSGAKSRATRYCCPLKDCNFTTDKEGLVGGAAAIHISRVHKVTAEIMKENRGKYKFKKFKSDRLR